MRRIGSDGLEIGYWVHAEFVGRGYATSAAQALTTLGLSLAGVTHIEIHHDRTNAASRRVPEKLGFKIVGERAVEATAPAETGVNCIWRMDATSWPRARAQLRRARMVTRRVSTEKERRVPVMSLRPAQANLEHACLANRNASALRDSGESAELASERERRQRPAHALGDADHSRCQHPLMLGLIASGGPGARTPRG